MLQKVQKYINELNMVSPEDRILIGVSGGADSIALLMVMHALYKDTSVTLEVVHVEHGIRGEESKRDETFVTDLCKKMGITCHVETVDVPGYCKRTGCGMEEGARILRYQEFSNLAKCMDAKVAVAHHMEDNVETILFQMARGSALAGMCGMQPMRTKDDGVTYIRPFLSIHRGEIEAYLMEHGQAYCVDSTNAQLDYSRNQLRHKVLPELNKVNEQATAHIHAAAESLSQIRDYLEQELQSKWDVCVKQTKNECSVNRKELLSLHPALQKEMLHRVIATLAGSSKDISAVHVKSVLDLCQSQSGKEVHLPYQILVKREYEWICFRVEKTREMKQGQSTEYIVSANDLEDCMQKKKMIQIPLGNYGAQISIQVLSDLQNCMEFPRNPYTKWLDYDKIKQGFCIRTRQSGDYFISDVFGHHKSLNRYFIDEKIPASERDAMWLLAQENEVLWLVGGRISEHIKITEYTKTIVEINYQGGKENER